MANMRPAKKMGRSASSQSNKVARLLGSAALERDVLSAIKWGAAHEINQRIIVRSQTLKHFWGHHNGNRLPMMGNALWSLAHR